MAKPSESIGRNSTGNQLVDALTVALSDAYNMYVMAHGAHWNVEGIEFSQYHDLFGNIYEDVYSSVDPIAENIRKLGYLAPTTLDEFVRNRSASAMPLSQDPKEMADALASENNVVLNSLKTAFQAASDANEQGIANFLAERIDKHQKWEWQLRSSTGSNVKGRAGLAPAPEFAANARLALLRKAAQ